VRTHHAEGQALDQAPHLAELARVLAGEQERDGVGAEIIYGVIGISRSVDHKGIGDAKDLLAKVAAIK
jgi:hypothetical protein